MQHWPYSEPANSSASQPNPDNSWKQKIHHRVQNSQPIVPIRAKLITVKTFNTISWRSSLILFFHLRLGLASCLLPSSFPTKSLYVFLFSSYVPQAFPLNHLINTNNIWSGAKVMKIIIMQIFPSSSHFLHVRSKYLPQQPILEYLQPLFVRQPVRSSFTPICNIWCYNSSLIKRSSE